MSVLMTCSISIAGDSGKSIVHTALSTPAKWPEAVDLTLKGWTRNTTLVSSGFDLYQTTNDSIGLGLLAFPPTDKNAEQWMDAALPILLKKDYDAGKKVFVLSNFNERIDGADVAIRSVMVLKENSKGKNHFLEMFAILRPGFPVQFSVSARGGVSPTDEQTHQAASIRFRANMVYDEARALLGLEPMLTLAADTLIYDRRADQKANPPKRTTDKQPKKNQNKQIQTNHKQTKLAASGNNLAVKFKPFPGPQVLLTGKWLGPLPTGYRFDGWTTHYWTNQSKTATKSDYLKLGGDGQFEVSSYSIVGGNGGVDGVITSSEKHGSIGTVSGNTKPQGAGAASVALIKREGLDESKYGTYFISGNQIEMRFANGKTVQQSFKTDGHHEMIVGGKRYFMHSPRGWERRNIGGNSQYRAIDGRYRAIVSTTDKNISNGKVWMERYLERIGSKRWFVSAGPIKLLEGKTDNYTLAKVSAVLVTNNGRKYNKDYYLKFGRFHNKLIQLQSYGDADDENRIFDFLYRI